MIHENKNHLLDLYFNEAKTGEKEEIIHHISSCKECRDYVKTLKKIDTALHKWNDEKPAADVLDRMMNIISESSSRPIPEESKISILHIIEIPLAVLSLICGLYLLNLKIAESPLWKLLTHFWPAQSLGSFGVTIIAFFLIGSFITLSIAPVLILYYKTMVVKEKLIYQGGPHVQH